MAVNPIYLKAVAAASQKYGVPADLLAAQIQAESGWNPKAKSPAGAVGISQFMPGTAKGFGIDPHDPLQSIDAQGKMMSRLIKSYKGNTDLALAAYNAGAGAVAKAGGKIPNIPETQNYVKKIASYRANYPGLAKGESPGLINEGPPLPSGGKSSAFTSPQPPSAGASDTSGAQTTGGSPVLGLTVGGLLASAKAHLGETKRQQGVSYIEQAHQEHTNLLLPNLDPLTQAPLPSGAFSATPVNKLKMSPAATADAKMSPSGKAIVDAAVAFKGTPYSWGGGSLSGPTTGVAQGAKTKGFDCSSLLQYSVYQATGKKIPRVAQAQYQAAQPVSIVNAKPGDAVFFGTVKNVHHVGIYIGNGKFIEAPHTGAVVRISTLADRKDIVGVGRF